MTLLDPAPPALAGTAVCSLDRLEVGRGVAALVEDRAVAVFRLDPTLLAPGDHGVRVVGNVDPHSGASVLSRGLLGVTLDDGELVHYVASPLRKQRFDLATGHELDGPARIERWDVDVVDGVVLVTSGRVSRAVNERETSP